LCGGFYVLFIHLLIIIKYTSIYTDYLLQKEMTKIHKEIKLQESLVNGALHGHGDFELSSPLSHLQCFKITWQSKSEKEKAVALQKFLSHGHKCPKKTEFTSSAPFTRLSCNSIPLCIL
jgi:hypothetical protein